MSEEVSVRVAFSATARFNKCVKMSREEFDRVSNLIDNDEEVDLTEFVDWGDPDGVSIWPGDIDEFSLHDPDEIRE